MKICRLCNVEQSLEDFPKRSSSRDGRRTECKSCIKAFHKANYQAKRELKLAKIAEYRATHKQEIRERDRNYRENNRDVLKVKKAEYYQANKEEIAKRMAAYHQTPRGKAVFKACGQRRRALVAGAEGSFTAEE